MLRKSFSSSKRATSREDEKTPASKAPSAVVLRRAPVPWIATTWPLLSINIADVALVSLFNFVSSAEIVASSRSEITRFVNCSIDAPPSVCTPAYLFMLLYVFLLYIHIFCTTLYQEPQEFHCDSL